MTQQETSIRTTHIFKREVIPHAPLRDIEQLASMTSEEKESRLEKSYTLFVNGNINIGDIARIHELYDEDYPRFTTKNTENHSTKHTPSPTNAEKLPDYSGAMRAIAVSLGEIPHSKR